MMVQKKLACYILMITFSLNISLANAAAPNPKEDPQQLRTEYDQQPHSLDDKDREIERLGAALQKERSRAEQLESRLQAVIKHNITLLPQLDEHLLYLLSDKRVDEARELLQLEPLLPLQVRNKSGMKALHIVVEHELHTILPLLLERKPIPGLNDEDYNERTPLEIALSLDSAQMVQLLCEYGSDHVKTLQQIITTSYTPEKSFSVEAFFIGIINKQNKPDDSDVSGGCIICFDKIALEDACIHQSCSAAFHQECIRDNREYNTRCPSCREETDVDDYATLANVKKLLKPTSSSSSSSSSSSWTFSLF